VLRCSCSALTALVLVLSLPACVSFKPAPIEGAEFHERIVDVEEEGIRVAVASLGRAETRSLFGADLFGDGIQPVWIEIENLSDSPYVFFQRTVDNNYYSALEASWIAHFRTWRPFYEHGLLSVLMWPLIPVAPFRAVSAAIANENMDDYFDEHAIGNQALEPGESGSGFVFTHADEGAKSVSISLVTVGGRRNFAVLTRVPGTRIDHEAIEFESLYERYEDFEWAGLIEQLNSLGCCVRDASGLLTGDPLNLVFVGDLDDLLHTFMLAGWDETEPLGLATAMKTAGAFVNGETYRNSPVSSLYVFNRKQDLALQKSRSTIHERNHMRLWYTPWRVDGRPVWVGQVSRDIGVRMTLRSPTLSTHKIDPDVDESRENVLGDLVETTRISQIGYIDTDFDRSRSDPGRNLTGDRFYTDGAWLVTTIESEDVEASLYDWHRGAVGPAAPTRPFSRGEFEMGE
jgi:hypothetical protein